MRELAIIRKRRKLGGEKFIKRKFMKNFKGKTENLYRN